MLACCFIISLTRLSTDGFVDQLLKGGALVQTKMAAKLRAKSLAEPCLLLNISRYLFMGIACQIPKFTTICIHSQSSLSEIAELLPLAIHETFWNVMLTESLTEFNPSSDLADRAHSFEVFPPKASRAFEVIGSISNLISFGYVGRT